MSKARLPFSVDRASRVKLPFQVADGLREAIRSGFYKPGDRLPGSRELKDQLGTSIRAPMEALRQLAREGLITLREKTGAVVNASKTPFRNGRVLLAMQGGAQIPEGAVIQERIRLKLNEARYQVVVLPVFRQGPHEEIDLTTLKDELLRPFELVLVPGSRPEIVAAVAESGLDFIVFNAKGDCPSGTCVGTIRNSKDEAVAAFIAHCRQAKVRSIGFVAKWKDDARDVRQALRRARIKVDEWIVRAPAGPVGRVGALMQAAYDVFDRRFAEKGKDDLPELLYFTDDYVFLGALTAMLQHRVRIPRDVKVICETNWGAVPPLGCGLTRIEHNAYAAGDAIGDSAVAYLANGKRLDGVCYGPRYVVAGSFA